VNKYCEGKVWKASSKQQKMILSWKQYKWIGEIEHELVTL